MKARNCKHLYYIIPDSRGYSIRVARIPADWSITGYVARVIGRVWEPFTPSSAGQHTDLETHIEQVNDLWEREYTGPERRGV